MININNGVVIVPAVTEKSRVLKDRWIKITIIFIQRKNLINTTLPRMLPIKSLLIKCID